MRMKRENRGLTLVELMITIAILAIVIAAATSFMVTGSKSFTKGSADSDLQKEAELTVNQIEDMVIDVNGGLDRTYEADADGNKTKAELVMYHATQEEDDLGTVETKYVKETVVWKKSDEKMYYSKWDVTYDSSSKSFVEGTQHADNQLLAERVSLFEVDLDTVDETTSDGTVYQIVRAVQIRVGYENSFGDVEYATSPTITLRNRMLLTDDPNEAFEVPQKVSAKGELWYNGNETGGVTVIIIDQQSEVSCGNDYQIYARLKEEGIEVNNQVNWEIETECNSTIDATGILHVGASEPNEFLTIVARKKADSNEFARGVVKVVDGRKSFEAITITTKSLEPFNPKFGSFPTFSEGLSEEEHKELEDSLTYEWTVSKPELVESMNSIDGDPSTLELKIKQDSSSYDQVFDITLTAHCPITGETRTDRIQYRVDSAGTKGGDSNMKRGMGVNGGHGYINYTFDKGIDGFSSYDVDYYFCDIYGNKITADNEKYGDSIVFNMVSPWTAYYTLTFNENLPADREFYVKVVVNFYNEWNNTNSHYERIHYIPAVQLYDTHEFVDKGGGNFEFWFGFVGYYELSMANAEDLLEFSIVEFDYTAPPGVSVTLPTDFQTEAKTENKVWCRGAVNSGSITAATGIKLQYLKLKVSLKGYEDSIYTYITIPFNW